ncbi:hypothetical protein CsSME_00038685 [Camellia sinensis var. sinensis]
MKPTKPRGRRRAPSSIGSTCQSISVHLLLPQFWCGFK